ncbi:hypothetical protein CR194_10830 [Salipaludibacillus keqinensis]|uniref:ATP-grasp domain-containing protein n=1 Tax=Salipaludibacillus keqinensis TaxID=2045207 RepID=A0A323TVT5_9BACI|nr:hypothetical protein [Salipaludibacillus keqinensis]PYZ93645.1 hypothetical protein CR194_10830 [Salipaludibacillus keqinensis]
MTHLTGWLIYREKDIVRNRRFIDMLQEAASSKEITLKLIPYEQLQIDVSQQAGFFPAKDGDKPDFIINRSVSPWLNELVELLGIRCFNRAYVSRIANDKRLSHAVLANIGIPMLQSSVIHRNRLTENESGFSSPYILKDPLGRGGTGVELIDPKKGLGNIAATLQEDLLHQPVGGKKGKDLRVYIVGNTIIGAVLRESATDFRANLSTGGNSSLYTLSDDEVSIVHKITNAIQIDFAGLDFLIGDDNRLLFNELEDAVGCRSLYMSSDINIADLFMDYIYQEMTPNQ